MRKKRLLSLIEALREAVPHCHSRRDLEPEITRRETYTCFVAALAELPVFHDSYWKDSRNGRTVVCH